MAYLATGHERAQGVATLGGAGELVVEVSPVTVPGVATERVFL